MAFVLHRCRELYNAALEERKEAWHKCGRRITVAQQCANCQTSKSYALRGCYEPSLTSAAWGARDR